VVAPEGTRGGAVWEVGGGGGRFAGGGAGSDGFGGCSCCEGVAGFFSQPDMEDCIVRVVVLLSVDGCRDVVTSRVEKWAARLSSANCVQRQSLPPRCVSTIWRWSDCIPHTEATSR
jgi:hypothetical protein